MLGDACPPVTTHSDVYTLGSVAMKVRSHFALRDMRESIVLNSNFPPLRKHDHGVTVDILAGHKPSHCVPTTCIGVSKNRASGLCEMMDNCWHKDHTSRPSMGPICKYPEKLMLENQAHCPFLLRDYTTS